MIKKEKLGEGTYGVVYAARSPTSGNNYAIKRNLVDKALSFHSGYRELDIMNSLRQHPNILRLDRVCVGNPFTQGMLSPINRTKHRGQKDNNLHFVFPRGSYDLHDFAFTSGICTYRQLHKLMVDILLGLEYVHAKGIMHRDLKPCNIIVFTEENDVRGCVADFGFAKFHSSQECHTPSIITSWYRPPEMALGQTDYDYKSDMWSVGCIFFEIIAHRAFLFNSKDDDADILRHIMRNIQEDIVPRRAKRSTHVRRLTLQEQINLSKEDVAKFEAEMGSYQQFLEMLGQLFRYYPNDRANVSTTLDHPFFAVHASYIAQVRKEYLPCPNPEHTLAIHPCPERAWIGEMVITIFNNRSKLAWYRPRILFQALDMFDRYLHKLSVLCPSPAKGSWFTRADIELRFYTCVYLSFKYFTSLPKPITFLSIVPEQLQSSEHQAKAEEFEFSFVYECLEYNIYRPTCFEAADHFHDRLSEVDIRNLLLLYCMNTSLSGLTPTQLYEYYRSHLRTQSVDKFMIPLPAGWREVYN